jgi:Aerotolerance regulator N-terminal/von Willebrand factor type A domain
VFLNPIMLAGIGGAVLPLVLHLLNRARYRTMDWGAMMFLPTVEGRQERSTRLKQLLLLLMRMAIVTLLAVALARPVVGSNWTAMGADPHCCAVILVDTSASMAYDDGGGPRIDAARRAALAVLAGLARGDEINLLTLGDERDATDTPPPSDLQTAASRIADLHVSDGRADIASGLTAASRLFQRSNAANRLLVLICDRQAASWKDVDRAFAANFRASIGGQSAGEKTQIATEPKFVVISVGSEACENVAVDRVGPPIAPVVSDVPVPLDITVHNYGRTAVHGLPVSLDSSNGRSVFQSTVDLAAGTSTTVAVTPHFTSVGRHVLHAHIGSEAHVPGNLTFDDDLETVVNVVSPLNVCIVTGEPKEGEPKEDVAIRQADALRLALMPYKVAGEKGPDLANVTIVNPTEPWPADLGSYRVIILADVPAVDETQAHELEQFVFDGGGLLIAPGILLRSQPYDDLLYRDGAGMLPGRISPSTAPSAAGNIVASDLAHPVFTFLRGNADASFGATIRRYLPVVVQPSEGRILARFSDGAPFLIEKTFGRGRVLLSTTTLGGAWSQLPRSNLFLPLIQSSIRYLAGGEEDQQTLLTGEPIEAHFSDALGDRATVVFPDGTRQPVDLVRTGVSQLVRVAGVHQPGLYDVIVHTAGADESKSFIVQNPRDESDLTPLTARRWADLAQWLDFTRTDAQAAGLAAQAGVRRGGREMWVTLIALVLGIALAESALSRLWSSEV